MFAMVTMSMSCVWEGQGALILYTVCVFICCNLFKSLLNKKKDRIKRAAHDWNNDFFVYALRGSFMKKNYKKVVGENNTYAISCNIRSSFNLLQTIDAKSLILSNKRKHKHFNVILQEFSSF